RPVRAAHWGAAQGAVLDAAEDREHVVPGPARIAGGREGVVVGAMATVVEHAVDRARAAERPAPHPVLALLRGPDRSGGAAPGLLGQGSQRGRRRATLVPEEGAGKGAPKPNLPSAR